MKFYQNIIMNLQFIDNNNVKKVKLICAIKIITIIKL